VALPMEQFKAELRYEPVGVVGLIVPWNYPALMAAWKIAPALAAGCTVILKPSEFTPVSALELADVFVKAGVPPGVVNILNGAGEIGAALVNHPHVDGISFTGSTITGQRIMKAAADSLKKVSLELGGKSPFIIFDDVEVDKAVEWIMFGFLFTNGQICSATSRVLLQEKIAPEVIRRLKEEVAKVNVGPPMNQDTKLGPICNRPQFEKILNYIAIAKEEGATLLVGGDSPKIGNGKGYYVNPTVFVDVTPKMRIWNEEIFGPVLSVMTFKTEDEAIALANDNNYGLAGAVMSSDAERTNRIASKVRCGIFWINCSQPCFCQVPWGGVKMSGIGRDLGTYGLDKFLEVKQVTSYVSNDPWGWYIKPKL